MFSFLYNSGEPLNCAYPVVKETLPKSSLGYNTNNQYPQFPPKMSDGRALIASWQPEAVVNNQIIKENGIQSNWQYRKFLTENARTIMTRDFTEACNDVGYYSRYTKEPESPLQNNGAVYPFSYSSYVDNSKPFGYISSDLKETYLSREQLEARKVAPAITQEQILQNMSKKDSARK
jgi:hypothetical protein